jgi:hypothetical protein
MQKCVCVWGGFGVVNVVTLLGRALILDEVSTVPAQNLCQLSSLNVYCRKAVCCLLLILNILLCFALCRLNHQPTDMHHDKRPDK